MASFIQFYFDTMPPIATLSMPSYTTTQATTHIVLNSDEYITNMFDIYTVDSNGFRRDYPMQVVNGTYYVKDMSFAEYPLGTVTFYASVRDEVGNEVALSPVSTQIFKSEYLECTVNDGVAVRIKTSQRDSNRCRISDKVAYPIKIKVEGSR